MWTLSRGLARKQKEYYASLVGADSDTAIDQVEFMEALLSPAFFIDRAFAYCRLREETKKLPVGSARVYRDALFKGKISRGDVTVLSTKSRRSAQDVTKALLERGYLKSRSPKGELTPTFPPSARSALFPELYPAGSPD